VPERLVQLTVGAGPVGAGGAISGVAAGRGGPGRGGSPYPAHPRRYVLPGSTTTRSTPAMPLTTASAIGAAKAASGRITASSSLGNNTAAAAAMPTLCSIARRLMLDLSSLMIRSPAEPRGAYLRRIANR